jgi:hypothetical protein
VWLNPDGRQVHWQIFALGVNGMDLSIKMAWNGQLQPRMHWVRC